MPTLTLPRLRKTLRFNRSTVNGHEIAHRSRFTPAEEDEIRVIGIW